MLERAPKPYPVLGGLCPWAPSEGASRWVANDEPELLKLIGDVLAPAEVGR